MRKPEEALLELFQLDQDIKPILWVGAGLSTAAGLNVALASGRRFRRVCAANEPAQM